MELKLTSKVNTLWGGGCLIFNGENNLLICNDSIKILLFNVWIVYQDLSGKTNYIVCSLSRWILMQSSAPYVQLGIDFWIHIGLSMQSTFFCYDTITLFRKWLKWAYNSLNAENSLFNMPKSS